MSDIHYIYGSRIQTPLTSNNVPIELGDTNGDGIIDILDASNVTASLIWDANQDGIIDILDAAEILANGGIPNNPFTTPDINPNPFTNPVKTCPTGQKLVDIMVAPGVTIKDCVDCLGTKLETAVCEACEGVSKGSEHAYTAKVTVLDYDNAIVTCEETPLCPLCIQCNEETCGEDGICPETNWWYIIGGNGCYATELDCYSQSCFINNEFPVLNSPEELEARTGLKTGTYYQQTSYFSLYSIVCDCFEYHSRKK